MTRIAELMLDWTNRKVRCLNGDDPRSMTGVTAGSVHVCKNDNQHFMTMGLRRYSNRKFSKLNFTLYNSEFDTHRRE